MLKYAVIFAFGAASGVGAAYFFLDKKLSEKYQKIADEKVRSMEDYVDSIRAKELAKEQGYISAEERERRIKEALKPQKEGKRRDYTSYYRSSDNKNRDENAVEKVTNATEELLNQYFAESESPVDEDILNDSDDTNSQEEIEYCEAKEASERANSKTKPFIIREDEWSDYPHHDKVTLYYFTEDETLVNEDNEIVDDEAALIGDAFEESGFTKNLDDTLYVRNFRRSTDYEIQKIFNAFSEY